MSHFSAIADDSEKVTKDVELRLFEDLFVYNKYDNSVRPVRNKTRPVQVELDVALVQLVDLVCETFVVILATHLKFKLTSISKDQAITSSLNSTSRSTSRISPSAIALSRITCPVLKADGEDVNAGSSKI